MMACVRIPPTTLGFVSSARRKPLKRFTSCNLKFPDFLPNDVENIKDSFARELASRIERVPVRHGSSDQFIMSSCVKPLVQSSKSPVVLLHGFDSSCLEWRYTLPLLEEAGLETWAIDILGWGFSDLEKLPSCSVASKRNHFYQLWQSSIKKPMTLVGPSLGAAVAIDFAVSYPEAVEKLVLIDASVYAEGTGNMKTLPKALAYAGVSILKSVPLRLYANFLSFKDISFVTSLDWTKVSLSRYCNPSIDYVIHLFLCYTSLDWTKIGRLHCIYPWWNDATVEFMMSGGYDVKGQISNVKQKTLIIWGEDDQIISNVFATRLQSEIPMSVLHQIPDCGHLPHVEKPRSVAALISEFVEQDRFQKDLQAVQL